jgi:hypothetical protein
MEKIKLTKEQKEILDRLNSMLFHDYWPIVLQSMENYEELKEYSDMDKHEKAIYTQGYAKAVWDITYNTEAAKDGYLPDDNTIKNWNKEKLEQLKKEGYKIEEKDGIIHISSKVKDE